MRLLPAALLFFLLPLSTHAQVRINEIAWMGASDNANAEWIELHNLGSDEVSLTGWKITSSTGAPIIAIAGSISGGGYYLLTRTSTNIIPGVTGDQAYTGALSNSGATLTLADASDVPSDVVVGGTNWANIGGDNVSKHTAQRTDAGSWITAVATPRAATASDGSGSGTTTPEDDTDSTNPSVSIGGSTVSNKAPLPPISQMYIHAGTDRIITTHAKETFEALVYDQAGSIYNGLRVTWSFGDGTQDIGTSAQHAYAYPGTYLVVIRANEGRASVIKTLTIVVKDAAVSIASDVDGVTVENTGSEILDLSGWKIEAPASAFSIPRDTAILPGSAVHLLSSVTGLPSSAPSVTLRYPDGDTAATASFDELDPVEVAVRPAPAYIEPEPEIVAESAEAVAQTAIPPLVAAAAVAEPQPMWTISLFDLVKRLVSH